MNRLYIDRPKEELDFIEEVCNEIISRPLEYRTNSNDFCAVFVEGRNREINTMEDLAAIYSFKRFSRFNYPVYCFVNNDTNFFNDNSSGDINYKNGLNKLLNQSRINIIKIPEINSLEEYSKFCINELYFNLPKWSENIITLQPDGMLLKSGWEDFIINGQFDWISPHWKHLAQVEIQHNEQWYIPKDWAPTSVGGGGLSFRKASKMREISNGLKGRVMREYGRNDNRPPMEDLFFCYAGFNAGVLKFPKLKDCDTFAIDPLTREVWEDKPNLPFGFHYFKTVSEFPKCIHN